MKKLILALAVLALTACATDDYAKYAEAQKAIASSKAGAETARYNALQAIATSGDTTAKVAAVISLTAMGAAQPAQSGISAPIPASQTALQWASILVPALTQTAGIVTNASVAKLQSNNQTQQAIVQSNNSATVQVNTNATMRDIANMITVPEPVIVTQPAPVIVNPVVVQPTVIQVPTAP